ncbi:MAG: site-specific DNA-methyltransferase [Treponema sp.]|jgi:adenine-specific DNA-methyltransferase|nr:site-specific DNA-methyltransferase [Treponema sp.]
MSTNVSKQKRTNLVQKIQKIHKYIASVKQDENTRNFLTWLTEIEKEINAKKFGLVFEEHREAIDETLETHTPVLTENKKLFIDNGGQVNFLIEGDNLAALQLLLKTHKGKIDVIYIDPPYNTGATNWKYDNDFVDENDTFRHSKWLSMMSIRLKTAKKLLIKEGVILITIDDYEISPLTLLANDIFGEDNRLGTVVIKNNPSGRSTSKGFAIAHEYALFYGRTAEVKIGRLKRTEKQISRYGEKDIIGNFEWVNFRKHGGYRQESPKMYFPIFLNIKDKLIRIPSVKWNDDKKEWLILEKTKTNEVMVFPLDDDGRERRWKWSIERAKSEISEMKFGFDRNKNPAVYIKSRMKDEGMLPLTWWDKTEYSATAHGNNLLMSIMNKKVFDYPKSLYAVEDCLRVATNSKYAIVLDFFAGSGTTGHAVMGLNSEDNGKRKFILCTNNENNICRDVTYERIKRVIKKENYSTSLKYFKIDYIPISDKLYYEYADKLLKHIRELVELENAINFIGNDTITIILTEEELDDFVRNIKQHKSCRIL